LRAAQLDRRIRLERRLEQTDPNSRELVVTFETIAEVWAGVEQLAAGERVGQDQVLAEATTRFSIRWRADISPLHRVVFESVPYDVVAVREEGRRIGLFIDAIARTERRA
jgi:SPP1 family predicted phage head-tail adaptor